MAIAIARQGHRDEALRYVASAISVHGRQEILNAARAHIRIGFSFGALGRGGGSG